MNRMAGTGWQNIHPVVVAAILLVHAVTAFLWEHPLLLAGQLLFLLWWCRVERCLRALRFFLYLGNGFILLFLLANSLFASNGETFLWKGPIWPVLGRIDITVEELAYSTTGLVRLFLLVVVAVLCHRLVDHDRLLFLFSKVASRFVITSVISVRLFPLLAHEMKRIHEIARLRGINLNAGGWRDRAAAYLFLLRPVLHTALEGAWMTAETLYARGFGSGPRSFYRPAVLSRSEKAALLLLAGGGLLALCGKLLSFGAFAFYPAIHWPDPVGDGMFLGMLLVVWVIPIVWLRGREAE